MQISIRRFRILVIAPIVLSFLTFALGFLPMAVLPEKAVEARSEQTRLISNHLVGIPMIMVLSLVYFVSIVGLMVFWNTARYLYAACFAVNFISMLFVNPHVESGLKHAFDMLIVLIMGMVIALSFWSELAELFSPRKRTEA